MHAADYGVPQIRKRVFFVGFRSKIQFDKFNPLQPTWGHLGKRCSSQTRSLFDDGLAKTGGVRECLGLPNIGFDKLSYQKCFHW
ncbi:DNA cytosine methyltransferase [Desulfonema magnum]|uniref:DNA methyltransferase domain-containing protein n=1 Tax=Desulfonema magnum TaxID=45655 RepID=A0A975BP03_9BACT|nr:DNA methyltransferase domain-containing protein [Desulfonema magnum]